MDKPERVMNYEGSKMKFLEYVDKLEAYVEVLEKRLTLYGVGAKLCDEPVDLNMDKKIIIECIALLNTANYDAETLNEKRNEVVKGLKVILRRPLFRGCKGFRMLSKLYYNAENK